MVAGSILGVLMLAASALAKDDPSISDLKRCHGYTVPRESPGRDWLGSIYYDSEPDV